MAVPRNRHSNARKNTRRAHHAHRLKSLTVCASCGEPKIPHRLCASCGVYRGRTMVASASEE